MLKLTCSKLNKWFLLWFVALMMIIICMFCDNSAQLSSETTFLHKTNPSSDHSFILYLLQI